MENNDTIMYKKMTFTLPETTVKKLKKLCETEHRSQSNLILHLIEDYEKFKETHAHLHEFLEKQKNKE